MKKKLSALLILGTATLAACGGPDAANNENNAAPPAQNASGSAEAGAPEAPQAAGEVYSGNGEVTEISENKVTISHGPIEAIDWPAMTMGFSVGSPDMLRGLKAGDKVDFRFQKAGADHLVTSINKAQ